MAGEGDAERLVVLLEARIRDFEKNIEKAVGTSERSYRRMRESSRSATRQMEADMTRASARINQLLASSSIGIGKFSGMLKGLGAGLLGAFGISATFEGIAKAIGDVAKLGDQAARAGNISVEVFQELQYAARQSRVEVNSVSEGMRELLSRANEFITTAKGPAAEAFKRLGLTPAELKQQLQDPAELLNRIINLTGTLNRSSRVKILNDLFGGSAGAEFLKFLDQGKDGIARLRKEARDSGEVLNESMVKRAAEIEKRFDNLKKKVGVELQKAILDAADALDKFMRRLPGKEVHVDDIGARIVAITKELITWEEQLADARNTASLTGLQVDRDRVALIEQRIKLLQDEEEKLKQRGWAATLNPGKNKPPFPDDGTGDYGNVSKVRSEYERLIERTRDSIAVKQEENAVLRTQNPLIDDFGFALSRARIHRELLTAAEKTAAENRTTVTPEQISTINQLADSYARTEAEARRLGRAQDEVRQRAEDMRSTSRDVMGGIITDFRRGASGAEIFANTLNKVADKLQDLALDSIFGTRGSGGLLGGLFGFGGGLLSLFGFANGGAFANGQLVPFANGGIVTRPTIFPFAKGTGLMGEAGPEAIMPLKRMPSGKLGVESGASRPAPTTQNIHVTSEVYVNENGNWEAKVVDIAKRETSDGIRSYDRTNLPDRIAQIKQHPRRR